ncbi:hypothetical protein A6P54_18630 [Bacillus sp. MKU004]|nr:hypothetical protein [[Bacillus] enclensis]MBH9964864.1 hypothetical protein [[Bacillus] enclensis]OAT85340.1 hypothetical protein A6P54_18630 [Bacillus sp. MKU004]
MERLFGALIMSMVLLTSALISVILSEEGFGFSLICIGLAALIGMILLTNSKGESSGGRLSDKEIEKELDKELTKGK